MQDATIQTSTDLFFFLPIIFNLRWIILLQRLFQMYTEAAVSRDLFYVCEFIETEFLGHIWIWYELLTSMKISMV